jgi:tetraacyldisaccharide 4'-kinase
MRAPDFWQAGQSSVLPALLSPLSALYGTGNRLRRAMATPAHAGVPVVCVGNLVAGGAGKTPTALAVAARLAAGGRSVHFLIRGYGGRLPGPLRVDPRRHGVAEVGDEALLLAASGPTWVARDRVAGAHAAVEAGADIIVMDDGFQNPSLHQDAALLVIDAGYGIGNGRILPAGPLREPPAAALERASAVVQIADPGAGVPASLPGMDEITVLHAHLAPVPGSESLAGSTVVAFAGIGRPEKFFATLEAIGCTVAAALPFPDHHAFSPDEIMRLVEEAAALDARLVTTAKDAVRLPPDARRMVEVLNVTLEFADPAALDRVLAPLLDAGNGQ